MRSDQGFSLIEMLIVLAIVAMLSSVLVENFRPAARNATARSQMAAIVAADIRRAQSLTLAGTGLARSPSLGTSCGYGIHYVDPSTYIIFRSVIPPGVGLSCASKGGRTYSDPKGNGNQKNDTTIETRVLPNSNMQIRSAFSDVFFQPPDAQVFIDGNANAAPITITIQLAGQADCVNQPCSVVTIYSSGKIDIQ